MSEDAPESISPKPDGTADIKHLELDKGDLVPPPKINQPSSLTPSTAIAASQGAVSCGMPRKKTYARFKKFCAHPLFAFGSGILFLFLAESMTHPFARDILLLAAWLCICIALLEAFRPQRGYHAGYLLTILIISIMGSLLVFAMFGKPLWDSESPFRVVIGWQEGYGPKPGGLWLVQNGIRVPIPFACEVSFTNLRDVPMMISSYVLERQSADGSWEIESVPFGMQGAQIFDGQKPEDADECQRQMLDDAIQDKNIAAHETVRGWIFVTKWPPTPMRMTLKDGTGTLFTAPVEIGWSKGWPVQRSTLQIIRKHIDISSIPIFTPPSSTPDKSTSPP